MKKLIKRLKMWLILILLPKTAIGMCEVIDNWSVTVYGKESSALWDILSALRGPDFLNNQENFDVKLRSTGIIRYKAFPKFSSRESVIINNLEKDIDKSILYKYENNEHFRFHILSAANALGIAIKQIEQL